MPADFSRLTRRKHGMPGFVLQALTARGVLADYRRRPAYQQNDYLGWILRAKLEGTRQRRLLQMMDELEAGGIYMKMPHFPSRKIP